MMRLEYTDTGRLKKKEIVAVPVRLLCYYKTEYKVYYYACALRGSTQTGYSS